MLVPKISSKEIINAHLRENDQRNYISKGLSLAKKNDLILISDVDEIPNLENLDFNVIKNNIIMLINSLKNIVEILLKPP